MAWWFPPLVGCGMFLSIHAFLWTPHLECYQFYCSWHPEVALGALVSYGLHGNWPSTVQHKQTIIRFHVSFVITLGGGIIWLSAVSVMIATICVGFFLL